MIVDVIIERKNNKNLYLRVKDDLKIHVTCNKFISEKKIKKLIEENENSILKMYNRELLKLKKSQEYYFLGNKCEVIYKDVIKPEINNNVIVVKDEKMLNKFYKDATIEVFNKRVNALKGLFTYLPKFTLKVRMMKSRWGVCNRSNNTITLNSELIKRDVALIDYVIIHEFCHFKHPNHSKKFWDEVYKYYPNYKLARKGLKEVY